MVSWGKGVPGRLGGCWRVLAGAGGCWLSSRELLQHTDSWCSLCPGRPWAPRPALSTSS
jgi:hypothetical protein